MKTGTKGLALLLALCLMLSVTAFASGEASGGASGGGSGEAGGLFDTADLEGEIAAAAAAAGYDYADLYEAVDWYLSNADALGMYVVRAEPGDPGQHHGSDEAISFGDFLNGIYDAITGGQAALSGQGEIDAAILRRLSPGGRYNNALAVLEYYDIDLYDIDVLLDKPVSPWDAVMILHYLKDTLDTGDAVTPSPTEAP